MDALPTVFIFIAIVVGLAALGLAAEIWGADSRPSIGDDHAR